MSMSETPQQAKESKTLFTVLIWIAITLVVPVVLIYGIYQVTSSNYIAPEERAAIQDSLTTELRIRPVGEYVFEAADANAVFSVEQTFKKTCAACHATGSLGSPKFGDNAAWAPRIATGLDNLTHSVVNGKGNMQPRGGIAEGKITELQLRMLVVYMANASGAKFTMPEEPAKPAAEEAKAK